MKLFLEHSQWPKVAKYLCKFGPPQEFDLALNMPPERAAIEKIKKIKKIKIS